MVKSAEHNQYLSPVDAKSSFNHLNKILETTSREFRHQTKYWRTQRAYNGTISNKCAMLCKIFRRLWTFRWFAAIYNSTWCLGRRDNQWFLSKKRERKRITSPLPRFFLPVDGFIESWNIDSCSDIMPKLCGFLTRSLQYEALNLRTGPDFIELLKQRSTLSMFLLSKRQQSQIVTWYFGW